MQSNLVFSALKKEKYYFDRFLVLINPVLATGLKKNCELE